MSLGQIELPVYRAEAITCDYRVRGNFQPIGPMLTFLNDSQRRYAQFQEATLAPFDAGNPLGELQRPVVMVRKEEIVAISILDQEGIDAARLLATRRKMIVYTPRFVIQGYFHMGADDVPLDILSSSANNFIGATETTLYPLQAVQHSPQMTSRLMLNNRQNILFYHLMDET